MQSQEARRQLMASEADKMQQPSLPPAEDAGTLFSALQQAENELAITRAALERKTRQRRRRRFGATTCKFTHKAMWLRLHPPRASTQTPSRALQIPLRRSLAGMFWKITCRSH